MVAGLWRLAGALKRNPQARQAQEDNRPRTGMSALWPRRGNALAAVSPVETQLALASQLIRAITN